MTSANDNARHAARGRASRGIFATIPIVLASSMAVSLGMTGPIEPQTPKRTEKPKTTPSELTKSLRTAFATATSATPAPEPEASTPTLTVADAPATYRVKAGDTISSIAAQYGLATASVLALNGLGWKSIIFPGQQIKLTNSGAVPLAATPVASPGIARYTIQSGDTMSHIAARFGVSTQLLLSANGLGWSSIIYPGQSIAIPAPGAASDTHGPAPSAPTGLDATLVSSVTPGSGITAEMAANATTIIKVGRSLGVPNYGIVIALAAALQESGLRNLGYGDRDSLGLFQQRPSTGWGTAAQVMNTTYAARLFFGGPSNPNKGNTRGLLDIAGWQAKSVTQAAQAVQRSAYPDAYAKWETTARTILAALG